MKDNNTSMQPRILIVDDNPKNLQVLAKALQSEKYEIEFAIDGSKALKWIKEEPFDLILLDIMMPNLNGFEVCKQIRENKDNEGLSVIFLTAKSDSESILEGFKVGGQDYVTKPFDSAELLARVKTQLELKFSREKLANVNKYLEEQVAQRTEELKQANEELQELDGVKNEFLNMLSHEIRTPLNGIMGPLQLLKSKTDSEDFLDLLNMLDDSVDRLEKFSISALLITRLKSKKYRIDNTEFSLLDLFGFVTIKFNEALTSKNIQIKSDNLPGELMVVADRELVNEVFERVIDNCIINTQENGSIEISGEIKSDQKEIIVRDNGKGFPDKVLKQGIGLFNPGKQHVSRNIGLSLYLCQLIMQNIGGELKIENHIEGGAIVRLIFYDKE